METTIENVLENVNNVTGITSIPESVGQQIYTTAALMALFDGTVMPALSVTLNGYNNQDQYQKDDCQHKVCSEYMLKEQCTLCFIFLQKIMLG